MRKKMYSRVCFFLAFVPVFVFPLAVQAAVHEVQNTYFYEDYSQLDAVTRGTSLAFILRAPQKLTLFGKVTYQKKFNRNESLQEAGGAYTLNDWLAFQGSTGFSIDTNTFPKAFLDIETVIRLREKLRGHVGYRFSHFDNSNVHIYPLGLTWSPWSILSFHGRFFYAATDFEEKGTVANNSFLVKASFYSFPHQEIHILYANNSESFLSIDRIGEFSADTYGVFWRGNFGKSWGILAAVYHQKRVAPVKQAQNTFETGWSYTW